MTNDTSFIFDPILQFSRPRHGHGEADGGGPTYEYGHGGGKAYCEGNNFGDGHGSGHAKGAGTLNLTRKECAGHGSGSMLTNNLGVGEEDADSCYYDLMILEISSVG
jgi:hypothetical protein